MVAIPQNDALKLHVEQCQGFQQHIHAFAANDLAGVDDEVAVAKMTAQVRIAHARHGGVDFNALGVEAVLYQFIAHVGGDHHHAFEFLIEGDLPFLFGVTHPFEGKPAAGVFHHGGQAREDAVGGGPLYPAWWQGIGLLVILAGTAAALSLTGISFNLGERHYRRRQGPGTFVKTIHGKFDELDALVLIAEPNSRMLAGGVTYHLVLHWKGQTQPIMVLQSDSRQLPPGQPLNIGAQQLLGQGLRYAQALGIPFFDNSHFASKCPVPIWK